MADTPARAIKNQSMLRDIRGGKDLTPTQEQIYGDRLNSFLSQGTPFDEAVTLALDNLPEPTIRGDTRPIAVTKAERLF